MTITERLDALGVSLAEAPHWLPLSRADVALLLGRPLRTIEDWAQHSHGPKCRVVARRATYQLGDVRRWLAGGTQ